MENQKLISVKDRLPNVEHGSFLVLAPKSFPKNSPFLVAEYYEDVKGFYSESSENFLDDVTHWCELPNQINVAPNWDVLREDFFNECTDTIKIDNEFGRESIVKQINITPHNLFEWFKSKINGK